MTLKCVAIDDEPWALAMITDYIKKCPFLELVFESNSAIETLQYLQTAQVDLLFLDIQMPDLTGMQLIKVMANKIPVVLTTAYSEYAIEGYEHNVIDYLLKPITFDRFYKSAEKARALLGEKIAPVIVESRVPEKIKPFSDDFIFIKTANKMVRVPLKDILFIEGLKDYIAVVTINEKLITLQNLRYMEDTLPLNLFIRVHKSYIVAINKIDTVEKNRIFMGNEAIPIGDTFRDLFFERIGK